MLLLHITTALAYLISYTRWCKPYQRRGCHVYGCYDTWLSVYNYKMIVCSTMTSYPRFKKDGVLRHNKLPDVMFQHHICAATSTCQNIYCFCSCSIRSNGSTKGGVLVRPPTPNCNTTFFHACMLCEPTRKRVQMRTDKQSTALQTCTGRQFAIMSLVL